MQGHAGPAPAELDALARRLRLTPRQRAFAEALAQDPNRNQARAAAAAGVAHPDRAAEYGCRWAKNPGVREYLAALTRSARQQVIAKTGRACANVAEVLEILTRQARSNIGQYLDASGRVHVESVREAPPGVVREYEHSDTAHGRRCRLKLESPQGAAEKLLRFHLGAYCNDRETASPSRVTVNVALLLADPALRRMLAERARIAPLEPEPEP